MHAAGAVAALALGCAILLHDHWLTLAIALVLPALAWIEARADLPPLRRVALAVAALVLARLLLNWYVLDYAFGTVPLANGLVAAYAAPAVAFAVAARLFRRRADDLLVAMLEAGAVAFMACFVALEIRHWLGGGNLEEPFDFSELAVHLPTLALQAAAYLYLADRTGRPMLRWAWRILGGAALILGIALIVPQSGVHRRRGRCDRFGGSLPDPGGPGGLGRAAHRLAPPAPGPRAPTRCWPGSPGSRCKFARPFTPS